MELSSLRGVSEARMKDFLKMGISSVEELPKYLPKNYLDLTQRKPLSSAYHNDFVLTVGELVSRPVMIKRGGRTFVKAAAQQGGEFFQIIWFNQPYVIKQLKEGELLFYGRVQNKLGAPTLINPVFEPLNQNNRLKGILPVYAVKGCITQKIMRDCVKTALNFTKAESVIPEELAEKYDLAPLSESYKELHFPTTMDGASLAVKRVAIEEYFSLISAFHYLKGETQGVRVFDYQYDKADFLSFVSRFPFTFTQGQKNAVNDIVKDMRSSRRMNRILQGDVGSGKTAVALCAVYMALSSGYQVAFIAPTEVLAEQDLHILQTYFPEYEIAFLSGSMTAKERREVKEGIKSGKIRAVCGTHAVLQQDVVFKNLSLCVCDEQQRFGVAQRNALVEKGTLVDVLVMSATPIPRTLSLVMYGDLEVSNIPDKPVKRKEVQTFVLASHEIHDMYRAVKTQTEAGNQVYFVCPKIEGEEESTVLCVTELFEELTALFPTLNIALLHGKMKDSQKAEIMRDFKNKKYHALVSTTIVEVGVDVPDATLMVVYNAERFGLSQLHQLRGRVGRSDKQSYCYLLSDSTTEKAQERLRVLKENSDGFKIAEYDFEIRGAGDFMGTRQSGKTLSALGGFTVSAETVFFAKTLAEEAENGNYDTDYVRLCVEKYEKLKDVVLN